eukprot:gene7586-biopygen7567
MAQAWRGLQATFWHEWSGVAHGAGMSGSQTGTPGGSAPPPRPQGSRRRHAAAWRRRCRG